MCLHLKILNITNKKVDAIIIFLLFQVGVRVRETEQCGPVMEGG